MRKPAHYAAALRGTTCGLSGMILARHFDPVIIPGKMKQNPLDS
jgi:hypothetical protein